jgi:hypothetical protein
MWCVISRKRQRPLAKAVAYVQLFNRILAPYVENLDMNQVNYGIGQGSGWSLVHVAKLIQLQVN